MHRFANGNVRVSRGVMPVVVAPRDIAASVVELSDALVSEPAPSADVAQRALERLRQRTHADTAVVWLITNERADRALHADDGTRDPPASTIELEKGAMALERLRRTGTLLCRCGDVSGVEELVPDGMRSFIVAAVTHGCALSGALVLGWDTASPTCSGAAFDHLRISAALLARAAARSSGTTDQSSIHDAVLGSLSDRIAVVDRRGTILAVNAAWTEFARRQGLSSPRGVGPGVNYFEVCRLAIENGCRDAVDALNGIEGVCNGDSELFETVYPCHTPGEERWYMMTATPLRHLNGGAVIAHSDITRHKIMELARHNSEELFHRLADTLPIPISIMAPNGRLVYGNRRWVDASGGHTARGVRASEWTDAFHPDDRAGAASVLQSAVSRSEGFELEVRVNAPAGTYRWSACIGSPVHASDGHASDGRLDSFVVFCSDISAKRRAESAFNEIAAKLVDAQERERSRIARELHDDLGQQVALLASKLDVAARSRERSGNRIRVGLAEAHKGLQDLATSVHNLSHELHPAKLKLIGLALTLETLCRNVSSENGVPIHFDRHGIPRDVPEDAALCLFRVAQEALQNAVKHSGAHSIDVKVTGTPAHLTLQIIDDGAGFDPLASPSAGLGLLTMRERVELTGGRLRIETSCRRGTMIEAIVPITHTGNGVGHDVDQRSGDAPAPDPRLIITRPAGAGPPQAPACARPTP